MVVAEARAEAFPQAGVEHRLAHVAEGRVPQVVPQGDRLGQVLVELERPRHRPGDPGRLERVREPGAVVVALGRDEDLGLVLEPAERLRVHDPVAVALERRAERRVLLRDGAASGIGARGERRERPLLERLDALPEARCGGGRGHGAIVPGRAAVAARFSRRATQPPSDLKPAART